MPKLGGGRGGQANFGNAKILTSPVLERMYMSFGGGLMGFWCRIYEFWCRIYATPGEGFCREVDGDYSRAVQAAPADGSISTIGM